MDAEYQTMPKFSGYLEKKGRKKMMSCYKKYWFVLEGRLLLYYKSKDEYEAISPCKGSINLGPTSNVKPCTSNIGVFQIESKTTTITLRAETREEQHKWMQAIMSALNQNNKSTKLSHFRYSLSELSPKVEKPPLERQHTFPEGLSNSSPKPNMKIIEKLQKIGAHTYGIGPKLQRSKTTLERPLERQKQIFFSDESLSSSENGKKYKVYHKTESIITENEEYGKLEAKKYTNSMGSAGGSSDELYERIPSTDSVFVRKEDELTIPETVLVDNIGYCSIDRNKSNDMTNEDIYSEPREVIQSGNNTTMTENENYWRRENFKVQRSSSEQNCKTIDYNDNNVEIRVQKQSQEINKMYSEATGDVNRSTGNSVEYDDIAQYAEISPRNSSLSSQGSNDDKEKKKFKAFGKKNKNLKEKSEDKKAKLRKSESFLQRVWLKKIKNKKNKKEMSLSNDNIAENLNMPQDDTIKMLAVLQDILEQKKNDLEKLGDGSEDVTHEFKDPESSMIYHEVQIQHSGNDKNQTNDDPPCPLLPPRNQKQKVLSPYHNVPKTQPILPPKKKKNTELALLDDILEDLNKQQSTLEKTLPDVNQEDQIRECSSPEGKVKALIKRFSIGKEEGVEMRKKSNWKINSDIYCPDTRELDILLEELSKVTSAPIMTPGVTTSLINPEISDTELLNMIPEKTRRRRISEPDYDIPRPHRSLTNLPKKDDNALEATRFFGPILKPSDLEKHATKRPVTPPEDYSNLPSITPDSLEVECQGSDLSHDENRNISFHSHEYSGYNKTSHNNLEFLVENNLYADPRLLYKCRNDYPRIYTHGTHFSRIEDSEVVFVDSLET